MPARTTTAQLEAQRRLRATLTAGVRRAWADLPAYDEANVSEWLERVLPLVAAAQRTSSALTNAYLARMLGRQPMPVDVAAVTGAAVRAGAQPADVYRRPFVNVWTALKAGRPYTDAVASGAARAAGTAAIDVQLAARATSAAVQNADPRIIGYQRVADPDCCDYCRMIDGAFVKRADAMALHNGCGCGLEPVLRDAPETEPELPDGVAVEAHGELGPVIVDPSDHFTRL